MKWDSRMGQGMVGEYLKRTMCVVGDMVERWVCCERAMGWDE